MKSQDIEHLKNVLQRAEDITDTDRSKLLELLNTFSGYGLVWVDKQEDNENKILNGQMPVLKENLSRYIKAQKETPSVSEPKNVLQTEILFEDNTDLRNLKDFVNLVSDKPAHPPEDVPNEYAGRIVQSLQEKKGTMITTYIARKPFQRRNTLSLIPLR